MFHSGFYPNTFSGYIQRWCFDLERVDDLVQKITDGQVKIFSWDRVRSGSLVTKVEFNHYHNNATKKSEAAAKDIELYPMLTDTTHEQVALLFIQIAKKDNATHICVSGVNYLDDDHTHMYFMDDTFLFIMGEKDRYIVK